MSKATPAQKGLIRNLRVRAEFDPRTLTVMDRRLGVPDELIGRPVETWLDALDAAAASALITKLKDLAEVEEEDED